MCQEKGIFMIMNMNKKDIFKRKYELWRAFSVLWILGLFLLPGLQAHAAFPPDMGRKPVVCRPLASDPVTYYADAKLTQEKGKIRGEDLVLHAKKARENALYGIFKCNGRQESGWFSLEDFVADPDYEDEYFTVRSGMTVYKDRWLDEVQDHIKKYSGVIVIGSRDDSRQVIYQRKKGYGIGWMSADTLTNTLIYDGREKQTLADGTYLFCCGYQDDQDGGTYPAGQDFLKSYLPRLWQIRHISRNHYTIMDKKTGKYLTVFTRDGGLSYDLCMTKKASSPDSVFYLERASGSYTIRSLKSGQFLGQDGKRNLALFRYRIGPEVCFRPDAPGKMLDAGSPMVFTQYDPAWCGTAYGSEGCMGTAGCGILAPVNAVYALTGQYMDVMKLADYAVEKNYRIVGSGTDEGIFKAAAKKFGQRYNFSWDGQGKSLSQLKKKLAKGDTAVVHVQGHYVAIVAYSKKKNRYLMLDSNYLPKREDTAFGDWISPGRLVEGTLEAQGYFYYKLRDPVSGIPADKEPADKET